MKILITGGAGYIGSVLTSTLINEGHFVRAIDTLWFEPSTPLQFINLNNYEFIKGNITEPHIIKEALKDIDYIIHTAAIVGDPASKLFPELTEKINNVASKQLIKLAKESAVKGIIFFSTCSNYGVSDSLANENSPLNPLSLYAETKVRVEKYLIEEKPIDYIICRLSTVYGLSPRMRFDLTVNDFTVNAYYSKKLDIFLPMSYRPYVHVYDISLVMKQFISKFDECKNDVYNLGFPGENYQKIEIANIVKKYIPDLEINILKEGGDKRDYRVDFSKIHKKLQLNQQFNVEKSVAHTINALKYGIFQNYTDKKYYNTTPNI